MNLFIATTATQTMDSSSIGGHGTFHYILIMALMMTGIYLILSRSNMIKSIIGLNLFQVAVIMFYVSMGRVENGTAPILIKEDVSHVEHDSSHGEQHEPSHGESQKATGDAPNVAHSPAPIVLEQQVHVVDAKGKNKTKEASIGPTTSKESKIVYSNPLPHVLMLTAIVVGVATTALALSLVVRINEHYGTIEEDELEEKGVLV